MNLGQQNICEHHVSLQHFFSALAFEAFHKRVHILVKYKIAFGTELSYLERERRYLGLVHYFWQKVQKSIQHDVFNSLEVQLVL